MKKIAIILAMSKEYSQLANMLCETQDITFGEDHYLQGRLGNLQIVLLHSGIGKVNAAMGTSLLIERMHPDAVISTGVAGGLSDTLHVMDVVVSTQTTYHDVWCGDGNEWGQVQGLPARLDSDKQLIETALSTQTDVRIVDGLICTGDIFVTKDEDIQRIQTAFPEAMAVDMESAAIAQVCHCRNVPFVSFRIISDTPGHQDNVAQYTDFWKTMADKSFEVTRAFINNIC